MFQANSCPHIANRKEKYGKKRKLTFGLVFPFIPGRNV